jgi:hypothetical protein
MIFSLFYLPFVGLISRFFLDGRRPGSVPAFQLRSRMPGAFQAIRGFKTLAYERPKKNTKQHCDAKNARTCTTCRLFIASEAIVLSMEI